MFERESRPGPGRVTTAAAEMQPAPAGARAAELRGMPYEAQVAALSPAPACRPNSQVDRIRSVLEVIRRQARENVALETQLEGELSRGQRLVRRMIGVKLPPVGRWHDLMSACERVDRELGSGDIQKAVQLLAVVQRMAAEAGAAYSRSLSEQLDNNAAVQRLEAGAALTQELSAKALGMAVATTMTPAGGGAASATAGGAFYGASSYLAHRLMGDSGAGQAAAADGVRLGGTAGGAAVSGGGTAGRVADAVIGNSTKTVSEYIADPEKERADWRERGLRKVGAVLASTLLDAGIAEATSLASAEIMKGATLDTALSAKVADHIMRVLLRVPADAASAMAQEALRSYAANKKPPTPDELSDIFLTNVAGGLADQVLEGLFK